jgi:hypothetical protein
MDVIARKYNALAAYSYLASLALYVVPYSYLFIKALGNSNMPIPLLLFLVAALLLGLLVAVGLQLKAGKMWAKVLVLLNAVSMTLFSLFFVLALFRSGLFTVLRTLSFLGLNLATICFLLKGDPQRAAAPEAGGAEGRRNRVN